MTFLENRIPPPLIALVIGAGMWAASMHASELDGLGNAGAYLAIVALLFGAFVSLAGIVAFRHARTTANPLKPQAASSFVVTGIYQYSRNPMYLGLAATLLAWSIHLNSPFGLLGVVVFVFYMNRFQIAPEERALESLFASEFLAYKGRVPRWL